VKYVTLYKRTRAATAAPTTWDATKKGWTKVARIRANGLGRYLSTYLKPTRTTWYVVRYPGDNWYWPAYTSSSRSGRTESTWGRSMQPPRRLHRPA